MKIADRASALKAEEGLEEHEDGPEPMYLLQHHLDQISVGYWLAVVDERQYEVWEPPGIYSTDWCVKASKLSHGSYVAYGETLEKAEDALVLQMREAKRDIDRLLNRGSGPFREDKGETRVFRLDVPIDTRHVKDT